VAEGGARGFFFFTPPTLTLFAAEEKGAKLMSSEGLEATEQEIEEALQGADAEGDSGDDDE
jgi:hypothetical protein